MDDALVRRIVEAALLASSQPLSLAQLCELFPDETPAPADSIERALQAFADESEQRGIELVEVASGFRFQIRAEVQPWVARLWTERQTRYSRALMETLALIAYRQPITRGEIEQIRGVAVSTNIVKTMEEREWVRVVGHRDVPGRPALYGTTRTFLDYFGLKSLDQLPPLTELQDLPDFEPQLALEPVGGPDADHGNGTTAPPSEPLPLADGVANQAEGGDSEAPSTAGDPAIDDDRGADIDQTNASDSEAASAEASDPAHTGPAEAPDTPPVSDSAQTSGAGAATALPISAEPGETDETKHDASPASSEQTR